MRLVIVNIDTYPKPVFRQSKLACHQSPGQLYCTLLEIIAEGKISQHLKKCVVPSRVPDVVQIIVLAARTQAFLRRHRARIRPLLNTRKHALELNHSRVGKQQAWILFGDQRR